MKQLLMTVAAFALLTTGAQAYEVTCNAPRVLLGADPNDINPVVSVDLRYVPEDHRGASSTTCATVWWCRVRSNTPFRMPRPTTWRSGRAANRQRNLYMVGEVDRGNDGGIYYHEWLYDRNKNALVMQSKALCRPGCRKHRW